MNDELNLESFNIDQNKPNAQFSQSLSNRMKRHHARVSIMAPFEKLTMMNWSTSAYYVVPVIALILIPGLLATPTLYKYAHFNAIKSSSDVQAIYQEAVGKKSRLAAAPVAAGDASSEFQSNSTVNTSMIIDPGFYQGNNYSTSKTTTTAGPKASSCKNNYAYDPTKIPYWTTSSTSYYSTTDGMYSTYITTGPDNTIIDYTLSTPTETITYKGGQYAVRQQQSQQIPVIMPMEQKAMPEVGTTESQLQIQPMESTEGSSIPSDGDSSVISDDNIAPDRIIDIQTPQLVSTETVNGVEYYVYQSDYPLYCDNVEQSSGFLRQWINPQTKELYKEQIFIQEANPANLVSETTYEMSTQDIELSAVKSQFVFNQSVDIRDLEEKTEYDRIAAYISQHNIPLLVPTDSTWKISYAYSFKAIDEEYRQSYSFDRAFYPAGSIGDYLFGMMSEYDKLNEKEDVQPDFEISLSRNDTITASIQSYDSSADMTKLYESLFPAENTSAAENITLPINGANTQAQVRTITYKATPLPADAIPLMEPATPDGTTSSDGTSTPGIMPIQEVKDQVSIVITFTYQQRNYVLSIGLYGEENSNWKDYVTGIKTIDATQLKDLYPTAPNMPVTLQGGMEPLTR
ncbi:hypothetical protein HGA91_05945 [candidate division WWE3 bacterium]|nr:hypothetical protein [candidate division WWE3 bacterium]